MAPLDDLIHSLLIALKNGFHAAIPAVLNPASHPYPKSRPLGVVAEEDSLNPSFNDHPCPHLSHIDFTIITGSV